MRQLLTIVPILGLALALSACSATRTGGAVAVQAFAATRAGEPVAAAIVDAMAGGLIGRMVGSRVDRRDQRRALEAEYRALEYAAPGETVSWGTEGAGLHGEVLAGAPYRVGSQDCRQYAHTVHSGGQAQSARGTACRNADGSWTPLA